MKTAAFAVVLCLFSSAAFAQATRTWISGVGDDVNPCSRTAPCKTFQGAISKTAANGEIDALDPAGFGGVTVTKSITLDGRGFVAGILVAGTNGVNVAAAATDTVVLRNLVFHAPSSPLAGVRIVSAKAVHIEDCTFVGFNNGIEILGNSGAQVFVKNVSILNSVTTGILIGSGAVSGAPKVVVNQSRVIGGKVCIDSQYGAQAILSDVVASACELGVRGAGTSEITVTRSVVAFADAGVLQEGSAVIRIGDNLIGNNNVGLSGSVASFGNNRLAAGNADAGTPTSSLPLQ